MIVFNLTDNPLQFHGKTIPANGGSVDIKGLKFIPDRDRKLEKDRVLAFGFLPRWFLVQQELKRLAAQVADAKKGVDALAAVIQPVLKEVDKHTHPMTPTLPDLKVTVTPVTIESKPSKFEKKKQNSD